MLYRGCDWKMQSSPVKAAQPSKGVMLVMQLSTSGVEVPMISMHVS
jgi:hypothetical protein